MLQMMINAGRKKKNTKGFQLWQHHFHPIQLDSAYLIEQKMEYLHMNPVKAGFVDKPEDYLYSSARNFAGLPGILDLDEPS